MYMWSAIKNHCQVSLSVDSQVSSMCFPNTSTLSLGVQIIPYSPGFLWRTLNIQEKNPPTSDNFLQYAMGDNLISPKYFYFILFFCGLNI